MVVNVVLAIFVADDDATIGIVALGVATDIVVVDTTVGIDDVAAAIYIVEVDYRYCCY